MKLCYKVRKDYQQKNFCNKWQNNQWQIKSGYTIKTKQYFIQIFCKKNEKQRLMKPKKHQSIRTSYKIGEQCCIIRLSNET